MNKLARNLLALMLVGSVLMVYGCSEDEGSTLPTQPSASNWRDLVVTLQNMDSHLGHMIAFRVVSKFEEENTTEWDVLRCVARIDTLDGTPFTFTMPLAVPEGVHRLDFWTDNNGNGWIDPSEPGGVSEMNDHSYRVMLPATGIATATFTHPDADADTIGHVIGSDTFVLDTNQPTWVRPPSHLWMNLTGMTSAIGYAMEVLVLEPTSGRALGYYRYASVAVDSFQIVLPNIAGLNDDGSGQDIQIDFYIDENGDGTYSTGEDSWSITGTVDVELDTLGAGLVIPMADSLVVDFAYNTNFTTIIWP